MRWPQPARVGLGDVGEHLELVGLDLAVRDLHPHHLVVAALALPVDALVEAEHAEHVVVDLAREEAARRRPRRLSSSSSISGSRGWARSSRTSIAIPGRRSYSGFRESKEPAGEVGEYRPQGAAHSCRGPRGVRPTEMLGALRRITTPTLGSTVKCRAKVIFCRDGRGWRTRLASPMPRPDPSGRRLPPLVPGRAQQGGAGRQRAGARHDGDPPLRLRDLGADAGRGRRSASRRAAPRTPTSRCSSRSPTSSARPSTSRASAPSSRSSRTPAARSSRSRSWCARRARRSSASSWPSGSRATATCRCCSTSGPTSCAGSCARASFLRTSEFLWQEGHTAHATEADAHDYAVRILHEVYEDFMVNVLAMPVRRRHEDRARALRRRRPTPSRCEAMMGDGKALQMGTSHELGQNFAARVRHRVPRRRRAAADRVDHVVGRVDAHGGRADHGARRRRRPPRAAGARADAGRGARGARRAATCSPRAGAIVDDLAAAGVRASPRRQGRRLARPPRHRLGAQGRARARRARPARPRRGRDRHGRAADRRCRRHAEGAGAVRRRGRQRSAPSSTCAQEVLLDEAAAFRAERTSVGDHDRRGQARRQRRAGPVCRGTTSAWRARRPWPRPA